MRELDIVASEASKDVNKINELVKQYKPYILKCASEISKKHITESDDEWSISLSAFIEAIKKYHYQNGSFLSFSDLVIKRRLIDFYKSKQKYNHELLVNPDVFNGETDDEEENISLILSVKEKISYQQDDNIKDEIEAISKVFSCYGFSFMDLATCSPKAEKTKDACAKIVSYILNNPVILNDLKHSKQLPIKIIQKNTNLPRKIIERHRKYIIAAVEILSGEYPYLAEYMWPIRKELSK